MARISGTVSRTIPLDPVIGRVLSLSGTFDLYVSQPELSAIVPILDTLIASGILTAHQRFFESDSLIASVTAPAVDLATSGVAAPVPTQMIPFAIPDAAGTTYTYTALKTMDVVDVVIHKVGAGTGTTYAVQDAAAAAITDTIALTAANGVGRAATIDRTKNRISAGAQFKIAVARTSGSSQAELHLVVILR